MALNSIDVKTIKKGLVYSIIPARSGSKGIVNKNIKSLFGYPLMAYSIAVSLHCKNINRTILSTDSLDYAKIGKAYGAEVPFLRPKELAGDLSTDFEFMEHAIMWFEQNERILPEYIVHLRPTYPFRKVDIVENAVDYIKEHEDASSLLSVFEPMDILSPYKWLKIEDGYLKSIIFDSVDDSNLPRQLYPRSYIRTVYVDIINVRSLIATGFLYGNRVLPFFTERGLDIDTLDTFNSANKDFDFSLFDNISLEKNECIDD